MSPEVRPYDPATDASWAERFLDDHLGGRRQARRGEIIDVLEAGLGFVARDRSGLLTALPDGNELELTALAAEPRGRGTGTALVDALVASARRRTVTRIWVVTTNDNLAALAFYQRRGFRLSDVRFGAVDQARRVLKPAIPLVGQRGIEMHDEIELTRIVRSP